MEELNNIKSNWHFQWTGVKGSTAPLAAALRGRGPTPTWRKRCTTSGTARWRRRRRRGSSASPTTASSCTSAASTASPSNWTRCARRRWKARPWPWLHPPADPTNSPPPPQPPQPPSNQPLTTTTTTLTTTTTTTRAIRTTTKRNHQQGPRLISIHRQFIRSIRSIRRWVIRRMRPRRWLHWADSNRPWIRIWVISAISPSRRWVTRLWWPPCRRRLGPRRRRRLLLLREPRRRQRRHRRSTSKTTASPRKKVPVHRRQPSICDWLVTPSCPLSICLNLDKFNKQTNKTKQNKWITSKIQQLLTFRLIINWLSSLQK